MIDLRRISKRFSTSGGDVLALDDVTLSIEEGEIFGIIGSSGAGKSTLLRCINLLERPDSGEVLVDGTDMLGLRRADLATRRRQIGMVFQQFNLLDGKTVFDNVALPMRLAGVPESEVRERVENLLGFVELSDKSRTYPPRLSGGQKQRVGIARALANNPRILLCDEATSALDPETTESILALLGRVRREFGITIVIITHEMQVIAKACDRVAVMSKGRVVEQGRVLDVFAAPREPMTRKFVRTIIDDRVPASLLPLLADTGRHQEVWRLTSVGRAASDPVLSELARRFGVESRVLYASMSEIHGEVLGVLLVQATADAEVLAHARASLGPDGPRLEIQDLAELRRASGEGVAA